MRSYKQKQVSDISGFTLYQGDALDVLHNLPGNMADAVLTDPPYSSGAAGLSGKQAAPASKYQSSGVAKTYPAMLGDGRDQRSLTLWASLWLAEAWRIAKDGAPLVLFTDWRQLPAFSDALQAAGWLWLGVVAWDKRSARPQRGRFRQQCEFVLWGGKGKLGVGHGRCLPGVYSYPVIPRDKVHLTGKPLGLIQDLMEIVPPGGTVLDPFIGGGTTALAALETGRKCVGVELSREYATLSVERVRALKGRQDCPEGGAR